MGNRVCNVKRGYLGNHDKILLKKKEKKEK